MALSRLQSTHGPTSARVAFTAGHTRLSSVQLGRDWSGFDRLAFDIHSGSAEPKEISLNLYDEVGGDAGKAAKHDSFDANRKILLLQGWNHIEVRLPHMQASNTAREIALQGIVRFALSVGRDRLPLTIHLDNLRLIEGDEPAASRSKTAASDAVTSIEDRWFTVRQVADPDAVPESARVTALRHSAERETQRLRDAIGAAQMQGLDTIYSERRLVIADLGLHVRPLLAWFNNDEQKSRMFKYVASVCRDERKLVEDRLNSRTRLPEVDDTQPAKPSIPALPELRGAPSRGWYFRDADGDPLMVISLHSPSVALQRFFATPLQHIESYSVGGGSRWTIEDSPVYEAFNKYPDTHRVGWDGWCGHLVKDLDSMGGNRLENVVICLESRYIRQALEEYIRINIPKLRSNPNLLYNILAYELTYICYCDESRRMFARWLRAKHQTIERANELWNTKYASFDQVIPPATLNARPLPGTDRGLWYDWARFNQDRFTDHLLWVRDTVRKYDPSMPLAAGGSSSMLSGRTGVSGIDEERIVNEVDDVIIHEGGGSTMGLDLQVALSERPKPIADPEMSLENVSNLMQHLLHGKSVVQLFHWPSQPPSEFVSTIRSSLAHSWEHSLESIDDLLRTTLDARRLRREIAAFVEQPAQVAILYSQTSTLQIPPEMLAWERTPYLSDLERTYTASRFLDAKVTFVTERQILSGRLGEFKLLLVPGAHAVSAAVVERIREFASAGGQVFLTPDSLSVDEYNRPRDYLSRFGIHVVSDGSLRAEASGERVQRYDQTFTESVSSADVAYVVTEATPGTPFSAIGSLQAEAGHQEVELSGDTQTLFQFPGGKLSLAAIHVGKGLLYYSAARIPGREYSLLLDAVFQQAAVRRDRRVRLVAPSAHWMIESRSAAIQGRQLQYITNFNSAPVAVVVQDAQGKSRAIRELRSERIIASGRIALAPGETVICEVH